MYLYPEYQIWSFLFKTINQLLFCYCIYIVETVEFKEKIKYYLRQNKCYRKYFQIIINDCRYFIRNCVYYYKLYQFHKDKDVTGNVVYFIIDPKIKHPGLTDRFKAIVGLYYIAKINHFDFKVIFNTPFRLNDYLSVNEYDWVGDENQLSYSIKNSRLISYNGDKILKLNKNVKQYHVYCYIGYDVLQRNSIEGYQKLWGNLYRELFKPSLTIKEKIDQLIISENSYVAVHLRFVNALQTIEEDQFNFLQPEQQEQLIIRCLNGIKSICKKHPDKKLIIFSDSPIFLKRAQSLPVLILEGEIGHISFANNIDKVVIKTFLDYYMIARAYKVYCIMAPEMYRTVYSYYASLIGGKEYEEFYV